MSKNLNSTIHMKRVGDRAWLRTYSENKGWGCRLILKIDIYFYIAMEWQLVVFAERCL